MTHEAAERLVEDVLEHHRDLMANPQTRNAVIIKTVALIALAFGIPPTADGEFDIEDIIGKLRRALADIEAAS